jgi:Tol biopolymer transport system component
MARGTWRWFRLLGLVLILGQTWGCAANVRLLGNPIAVNGLGLNSPYGETMPEMSGRFVAFVSDRNGSQDVYLWDILDRKLIPLPGLNRFDRLASDPSVSEDGRYIAFAANQGEAVGIYLYDRTSQQVRPIGRDLRAEVRHPHLSANGERLTFEVNAKGQWDVVVYSRTGERVFGP